MEDEHRLRDELRDLVSPYRDLIVDFIEGRVSAIAFEKSFQPRYLADETPRSDRAFQIFDRFFSDVDELVDDPGLRAETGGLGPSELRDCAIRLLERAELLPTNLR